MQLDSSKPHVKNFIEIMINDKKQEWIKVVCNRDVFPFIYNEIINANQNPGFNLEKFQKSPTCCRRVYYICNQLSDQEKFRKDIQIFFLLE